MKSHIKATEGAGKDPDNTVEDDELKYLVEKEETIVANRLYFSWDPQAPTVITSFEKTSSLPTAIIRQTDTSPPASPHESSKEVEAPSLSEPDHYLLPSLDLMGLFEDQDLSAISDVDESLEPDLELEGIFNNEPIAQNNVLEDQDDVSLSQAMDQNGDTFPVETKQDDEDENTDLEEMDTAFDDLLTFVTAYSEESIFDDDIEPDWLELAGEVDEFDADIASKFEGVEVKGYVSHEGRALQVAMEIGCIFNLTEQEVLSIALILEQNGWSACKEAINRELSNGTTVAELQLAAEIKEMWLEHYEFYSGQTSNYRILSWGTALRLANSFTSYPDIEEVELLLVHLHYHWSTNMIQRRIFFTFNEYLIAHVSRVIDELDHATEWVIEQETSKCDDYLILPPSSTDIPTKHDYEFERSLRAMRSLNISLN